MTSVGRQSPSRTGPLVTSSGPGKTAAPPAVGHIVSQLPPTVAGPPPPPPPRDQAKVTAYQKAPCQPTGAVVAKPIESIRLTPGQAAELTKALTSTMGHLINSQGDERAMAAGVAAFAARAEAILGRNFATGVLRGVAERADAILETLREARNDPFQAAAVMTAVLCVALAEAVPVLGPMVNALLVGLAGADACQAWRQAVEHAFAGEGYEAGRHGGMAAIDSLLAVGGALSLGRVARNVGTMEDTALRIQSAASRIPQAAIKAGITRLGTRLAEAYRTARSSLASAPAAALRQGMRQIGSGAYKVVDASETGKTVCRLVPGQRGE